MADVFGIGPGPQTTAWAGYTFIDRSLALPAGATITHLALHSGGAINSRPKIAREISATQYEIVSDGAAFSHPGGGYQWAPLSYVVPGTGVYRPAWFVNGTVTRSLDPAQRSSAPGDVVGTAAFTTDALGLPPMGYRTQDGGSPPPPPPPSPPPPPPGGGHKIQIAGQSNGKLLAANPLIASVFQATADAPLAVIDACHNGSQIAEWAPGSTYLNQAIAQWNAGAGAPLAWVWYQGEGAGSVAANAIRYDEAFGPVAAAFRAGVGLPSLPIVIVTLHANHESTRPYYDRVQLLQGLMCEPGYPHHVPNSISLDLSDLDGTTDGVHLTQFLLDVAARRLGALLGLHAL